MKFPRRLPPVYLLVDCPSTAGSLPPERLLDADTRGKMDWVVNHRRLGARVALNARLLTSIDLMCSSSMSDLVLGKFLTNRGEYKHAWQHT